MAAPLTPNRQQPHRDRSPSTIQAANVLREYNVNSTIGEGGFAKVKLATHKLTGVEIAIKIVDKTKLSPQDMGRLQREINALRRLKHQHICQLYEVHDTEHLTYILMEVCACRGGVCEGREGGCVRACAFGCVFAQVRPSMVCVCVCVRACMCADI